MSSPTPGSGFLVSPAKVELLVPPGTKKSFSLSIQNLSGVTETYALGAEDIAPGKDSDIVLLGGTNSGYSLNGDILSQSATIAIPAGETRDVPFVVSVPAGITSQGLYGAVTVTALSTGMKPSGTSAEVHSRIGVGVLVRTVDKPKVSGELVDFDTANRSHFESLGPVTFKLGYTNDGNVHIEPAGLLTITNILGKQSYSAPVNPFLILPESTRSETLKLGSSFMLGRYVATLAMEDGFGGHHQERSVTLWVLPWQVLLGIAALVFVALFLKYRFVSKTA